MNRRLLIPFAIAVFLSASLVFLVQPLFAKLLLPRFGGAPAVWNTCTVFFQAILLVGYCYTWLTTKWLSPKRQIIVHCLVLLATMAFLPVDLPGPEAYSDWNPVFGLIATLVVTLGGPYFAVSTTTPLIQHWFSGIGHERSSDPYFLYAVSNAGSFVGLLAYPFAVELMFDSATQRVLWTVGYGSLIALTLFCGWLRFRVTNASSSPSESGTDSDLQTNPQTSETPKDKSARLTFARRLRWVLLSFVPSALMLGVTTRITTDVASVPLFWVMPLAIYLATYIHAFARRRVISTKLLSLLLYPTLCLIAWSIQLGIGSLFRASLDIWLFVLCALLFHGRLADDRPSTKHLTEYYFWLALGGCLGGTLVGLIAPIVFPSNWEFPLTMVVASAIGAFSESPRGKIRSIVVGLVLILFAGTAILARLNDVKQSATISTLLMVGYFGLAVFYWIRQTRGFAVAFALVVLPVVVFPVESSLLRERSFFGIIEVRVTSTTNALGQITIHRLVHGTTGHGQQVMNSPQYSCVPLIYYGPTGPIGNAFNEIRPQQARRVGVIGLGAGAVHCYSKKKDQFDYYEIDPAIRDIALNPKYFTYLQCGGAKPTIHVGDGRILLGKTDDGIYDLLLLDAFGSDSVPVHLMTAEALDLFVSKLKPGGVLVVHISNRFLDLEPVLGRYAASRKLATLARNQDQVTAQEGMTGQTPTHAVAIARSMADLKPLRDLNFGLRPRLGWVPTRDESSLWTDQHSSILEHSRILDHISYGFRTMFAK
jgi:hypothetical protein